MIAKVVSLWILKPSSGSTTNASFTPSSLVRVGLLELDRAGEQREPRDDTVGVEAVGRAPGVVRVGRGAGLGERDALELHAGGVEVLVLAALRVHAVEAAYDVVIDHVDDRLGH